MLVSGNTVLLTGGGAGIGLAMAKALAVRRHKVIICGRNVESLTRARASEPALITRVCDITDANSRRSLVTWLTSAHPELDVLINNAGVQHFRDVDAADWLDGMESEVATNFTAPVRLTAEILPLLRRRPRALIVNVSSGLAFSPMADSPIYCAAKAAMHSFTLSLRHQLRATPIRVVEIAPPRVDTALGGARRSGTEGDPRGLDPDAFAREALAMLEAGGDEVLVGRAKDIRAKGEAMFALMNGA